METPPNIIEVAVPADQWQRAEEVYTELLGPPRTTATSALVFKLSDTYEVHLIKDYASDARLVKPEKPVQRQKVKKDIDVESVYRIYITKGAKSIIEPHRLYPIATSEADVTTLRHVITLAYVLVSTRAGEQVLLCIVHNPDWDLM